MHVRYSRPEDLPGVTDVSTAAFYDDELFDAFAPGRAEHPETWWGWMADMRRGSMLTPHTVQTICVTDIEDSFYDAARGEEIMGYANYALVINERPLPDVTPVTLADVIPWENPNESARFKLERLLRGWHGAVSGRLRGWLSLARPGIDQAAWDWMCAQADERNFWGPLPYHLDMRLLAVAPKFQRRGVGGRLLKWGINYVAAHDASSGQHTPVTLHASPAGLGLYKKVCFRVMGYTPFTDPARTDRTQIVCPALMYDPHQHWSEHVDAKDDKGREIGAVFKNSPAAKP